MDIEAIVKKFAGGFLGIDGRSARNILRAALTELAAGYEHRIIALNREVVEANERIRQLEAERVPAQQYTTGHCANKAQPGGCQLHNLHCNYPICDRRPAAPRRCHLCDYQHGHKIGCVNNPVDIAMRAAAPQQQPKKESGHD